MIRPRRMHGARVVAALALCASTALVAGAAAQSRGANRGETTTFRTEQNLELTIEVDAPPNLQCEANGATSYHQRDTVARVETTISTAACPAAGGTFNLTVRVRDAGGEVKALEFPEAWQRTDGANVVLTKDYPIGDNVELVSARVRGLTCKCAAPVDSAPQ